MLLKRRLLQVYIDALMEFQQHSMNTERQLFLRAPEDYFMTTGLRFKALNEHVNYCQNYKIINTLKRRHAFESVDSIEKKRADSLHSQVWPK